MKRIIVLSSILGLVLTSCVSQKEFDALNGKYTKALDELGVYEGRLQDCKTEKSNLESKNGALNSQISSLEGNIATLQKSLESCVSLNQQGNTNISKLIDEINSSNSYIKDLIAQNQKQDSLNKALSGRLKRSLDDVNDQDVQIQVKKGVVFISLSDKMLFKSGKYEINTNAATVLAKIGKVVNDYKDYDILIEGHTDNVPISNKLIKDNWDLSAMRATAIARYLQNDLQVNPARITAGARSEYVPKASNLTPEGRAINRRTEIIILPKLEEFMKLMDIQAKNVQK
ncbi:putative 24.6 kDa protein in ccpA 3'region [Flavobacteriaceae bacterium UJ101]|nr:putative 24.6 kDa protein in ccpA 3'region [Flavobacteriaceae bacterium UJ101]